jgi:hypothetical protein
MEHSQGSWLQNAMLSVSCDVISAQAPPGVVRFAGTAAGCV